MPFYFIAENREKSDAGHFEYLYRSPHVGPHAFSRFARRTTSKTGKIVYTLQYISEQFCLF